jgi:formate-dependent nitrite reductase cytochrome c552 subunit
VAYQAGWSDWCANCHGFYHDEGGNIFEHPVAGTLSGVEAATYNQYDGDANPSGGLYATAYLTEVPLQDPSLTSTSTGGATSSSQISCMTCHRAHATSAPYALRWDPNVLALGDDGVVSGSWPIPNPYFASSQRSLCVKCHEPQTRQHHDNRPCLACHRNRVGGTVSDPLPDVFGQ